MQARARGETTFPRGATHPQEASTSGSGWAPKSILYEEQPINGAPAPSDVAALRAQLDAANRECATWKQHVADIRSGNAAVDVIMEELLRENLTLMDRVATLADEQEVWRQTAECAALPGQGLLGVDGVSQLQEELARLSVENEYLRQALGDRGAAALGDMDLSTLPPDVATRMVMLISEVEELSQQLNDQYEEEVRSINAEALRELDELRQTNTHLGEEVGRLRGQLTASAAQTSDTARLDQLQQELERMGVENNELMARHNELQHRHRALAEERDALADQAGKGSGRGDAGEDAMRWIKDMTDESGGMLEELRGMGERVHELMRLNAALVDSNQQLQHRLIQAALGDDEAEGFGPARTVSVENDALARRYSELQQSLAAEEERRREAFTRRLKLQTKGQRLVEAAAKGAARGGPEGGPGPEEAAAIKAREAQRREEREVARLALQKRMEERAREREEELKRKQEEAVQKMRAEERARAKEAQAMMELKKDAGKRVNLSYNKFAGNEDVGAFMRSLGYSNYTIEISSDPSDDELRDAFKRAVVMTHPDRWVNKGLPERALAEATYTKLQAWMRDCNL